MIGLKTIPEGQQFNPYDDLIRKLTIQGKKEFFRRDIEDICNKEGLWEKRLENILKINLIAQEHDELDRQYRLLRARCISRWRALGVQENDAIPLFDNPEVGGLKDINLSSQKLLLLVGEMGTGKSLSIDRILQSAIQQAKEDKDAPYPIYLTPGIIKESKSFEKAIFSILDKGYAVSRTKILILVDSPDELGGSFANELLNQARLMAEAQEGWSIVIASRLLPNYLAAEECKRIPLLNLEQASNLIFQISKHSIKGLAHHLSEPVKDAIKRPLFAILLGLYLREEQGKIPCSKEKLLEYLIKRSLEPLRSTLIEADKLLQNLAVNLINNDGLAVPANNIVSWHELDKLLETGLVVNNRDKLEFPLPVLTQWFAAYSLNSGYTDLEELADDSEKLELWQYPLVIAVSTANPSRALEILTIVVTKNPVLGAEIIREALANKSYSFNTKLPSSKDVGHQVLVAMQAWIQGLGSLGSLLIPIDERGNLRRLGVRIYREPLVDGTKQGEQKTAVVRADIAWGRHTAGSQLADLPHDISSLELLDSGWSQIHSFNLPSDSLWNWDWTHKNVKESLQNLISRRGLPVLGSASEFHPAWLTMPPLPGIFPPQSALLPTDISGYHSSECRSMLVREGAWHAAIFLAQQYSSNSIDLTPISLEHLAHLINSYRDYTSFLGQGVDPIRLNQLILEIEYLKSLDEKYLFYPWINLFNRNPEVLLEHVTSIYKHALEEYCRLVKKWFPQFISWLDIASKFPVCIKGQLSVSQSGKDRICLVLCGINKPMI